MPRRRSARAARVQPHRRGHARGHPGVRSRSTSPTSSSATSSASTDIAAAPSGVTTQVEPEIVVAQVAAPASRPVERGRRGRRRRGRGGRGAECRRRRPTDVRGRRRRRVTGAAAADRAPRPAPRPTCWSSGSGNPGDEYARTRHNVGAEVVELLAKRHGASLRKGKERARADEVRIGGEAGRAGDPAHVHERLRTRGGAARAPVTAWSPTQLVVVHDELDLPDGGAAGEGRRRPRRPQRSALDQGAPALRRRSCACASAWASRSSKEHGADHVLKRFSKRERAEIDVTIEQAADAVELDRRRRRRRRDEPLQLTPLIGLYGCGRSGDPRVHGVAPGFLRVL